MWAEQSSSPSCQAQHAESAVGPARAIAAEPESSFSTNPAPPLMPHAGVINELIPIERIVTEMGANRQ